MENKNKYLKVIKRFEQQTIENGEINVFGDYSLKTKNIFSLYRKHGDTKYLMLNRRAGEGISTPLGLFIYNDDEIIKVVDKNKVNDQLFEFCEEYFK